MDLGRFSVLVEKYWLNFSEGHVELFRNLQGSFGSKHQARSSCRDYCDALKSSLSLDRSIRRFRWPKQTWHDSTVRFWAHCCGRRGTHSHLVASNFWQEGRPKWGRKRWTIAIISKQQPHSKVTLGTENEQLLQQQKCQTTMSHQSRIRSFFACAWVDAGCHLFWVSSCDVPPSSFGPVWP